MGGSRRQHQYPIESQRHPGAVGQARGQRGEQSLVHLMDRQSALLPVAQVVGKAGALFIRCRQLVKAVGELKACQIKLEALGRARIKRIQACQGGL